MSDRFDHAAEALSLLATPAALAESIKGREEVSEEWVDDLRDAAARSIATAQVHATLALVEQARHVALDHAADLISEIRRLRAEVERLARWKAEALPVLSGLQDLGNALGVPLGQSITSPESVQRARDMAAALDQVRAALANHPRACDTHPEGDPITCGWKRAVADVEAALGVTS